MNFVVAEHSLNFYGKCNDPKNVKKYECRCSLGLQWGDEGKGKIVDSISEKYFLIACFQGGPNAGHTIKFDKIKHVLHTIPSGIFNNKTKNLVGNGVVIDPIIFADELKKLDNLNVSYKNLYISRKAHLILPTHKHLDAASEIAKGKKTFNFKRNWSYIYG